MQPTRQPPVLPPTFDILGPTGQRVTIIPNSRSDTVGDLAQALGLGPGPIEIDRRTTPHTETLVASGVRSGSDVSRPERHVPSETPLSAAVEIVITTGPDCSRPMPLPVGRHVVGRSALADVRIDDPGVELHHGILDVASGGAVAFTQLTGRVTATIDQRPCAGRSTLPIGGVLAFGSSRLELRRTGDDVDGSSDGVGSVVASDTDPWRRIVRRGPHVAIEADDDDLSVPATPDDHPSPPATGLVGAAIAVIGAGGVALVLGQMMFALFALVGACASVGTWAVGVLSVIRRRRRARKSRHAAVAVFLAELESARDRARRVHDAAHPAVDATLAVVDRLTHPTASTTPVWDRRPDAPTDPLRAVVGRGSVRWPVPIGEAEQNELTHDLVAAVDRASMLVDVAVPIRLHARETMAIRGSHAQVASVTRSLITQLATSYGPADWRLLVVSRDPAVWNWIGWLPQATTCDPRSGGGVLDARDAGALAAGLDAVRNSDDRPSVLVVDDPALFTTRTGALRRFVETTGPRTLALVGSNATVPAVCTRVLTIGSTGSATWSGDRSDTDDAIDIRVSGISVATATAVARSLAGLIDPEDVSGDDATVLSSLALTDLDDATAGVCAGVCAAVRDGVGDGDDRARRAAAATISRRWSAAGPDPAPRAPIGSSVDGVVEVDLVADGPHALIAGTTGAGKSELLRTLVVSLASRLSPDHLTFVLIDYKGGSTFDACARLPHTVGVVTDLDDGLAERALLSLEAELSRRERALRDAGASDLTDYRAIGGVDPLPRLVVVIDEFAALAKELPDFLAALVGVAQRGRSLGIHLVLATQRPAGVVSDDIRANTNLRLALRLNDSADAHDVVGDDRPSEFPRHIPGRAALRLGPDELMVFQTARCTGPVQTRSDRLRVDVFGRSRVGDDRSTSKSELDVAVAVIVDATAAAQISAPHCPWIASLPDMLEHRDVDVVAAVPHDAIGLIDDPAAQCRRPLRWNHEAGNLALVGSLGAGTTSTLIALVTARCRLARPDELHCYVIDARGDSALDGLVGLAHCGGLIRLREAERLHRTLARLVADIDDRASGDEVPERPQILLAIDGLGSLRTALSSIDVAPTRELLDRVLADGPAVGVTVCWSIDGSAALSAALPAADTWVFHLDDADTARSIVAGHRPVADVAGRARIVSSGLEAQVAVGAAGLASLPDRSCQLGPPPIEALPKRVGAASLSRRRQLGSNRSMCELAIGLASDDLDIAMLRVPALDHIFIGGAASTGKTTALAQIVDAWRQGHDDGTIIVVDRGAPLTEERLATTAGHPTLIVVDDAERIGDDGGIFARVLSTGPSGVTIAAAARLEAVRSSYGHWTREIARSRCGLILTSPGDVDGDLLGVTLPRRSLVAPRPGLGWLIDTSGCRLVQVAVNDDLACRTYESTLGGDSGVGGESPRSHRGPDPNPPAESPGL